MGSRFRGKCRLLGSFECFEFFDALGDSFKFWLGELGLIDTCRDHQESIDRNLLLAVFAGIFVVGWFEASSCTFSEAEQVLHTVLEGDLEISVH